MIDFLILLLIIEYAHEVKKESIIVVIYIAIR